VAFLVAATFNFMIPRMMPGDPTDIMLSHADGTIPPEAREALKAWMKGQPSGIEGRRQMPQFNLSEKELDDLINFFKWTSEIDTQNWPPKVSG